MRYHGANDATDSSKRAVEAVDNVVHAYDLNMQMPETPLENNDSAELANAPLFAPLADPFRPDIVIEGSGIPLVAATNKRQRDDEVGFHPGPPMKRLPSITEGGLRKVYDDCSSPTTSIVAEADETSTIDLDTTERHHFSQSPSPSFPLASPDGVMRTPAVSPPPLFNKNLTSDRRQISTRSFIRNLVDQAIRSMRPVDKVRVPHNMGEIIYVKTEGPRGDIDEVTINVVVSPEMPERIITKELHLTFAVMKVVDNAIKFTPSGEITVSMRLSRNRQLVEISVIDTGCGISEESKEHLFKPHFQEDATISRSRDGLGLSLFNAKAHVRRSLSGEMTLERSSISGPSKGSEFLIRFPLEVHRDRASSLPPKTPAQLIDSPTISPRASPQLHSHHAINGYASYPSPGLPTRPFDPIPPPALVSRPPTKKSSFDRDLASRIPLTFLVAEDNAVNRSILVSYLKKLGYAATSISIAFDGAEAVEQYTASLSAGGVPIDAVLMDLWMPNVDGYEATKRILEMAAARKGSGEGECEEGPVVFAVSADITSDSLARAKGAGMRGFVSKPYRVMDIQKLIVEHFGDREEEVR
jgi:CheY-like chemotaxis protein/anti-sigma regulatory factor (Ser/Thr protein kinase)